MAVWAKVKFLYQTMLGSAGSTLTADSTESTGDYDVAYLFNMLETNFWKSANTTSPQYITYDAGALTGSNLVTNGGFDSDTSGWTPTNGTLASVAGGQSGNCLEITFVSGTNQSVYQEISGLTVGETYEFSTYVKSGTSGDEAYLIVVDPAGGGANIADKAGTTTSSWVLDSLVFVATGTTHRFKTEKNTATAGTMLFDTVSLLGETTKTSDYLAIIGHNLNTAGVQIGLQHSPDNSTWTDAFTAEDVSADTAYLKEFTGPTGGRRYWRLSLANQTIAPYMSLCIWGDKTELDYASTEFDPLAQNTRANVNITQGGYVAGIHTKYTERSMSLKFNDVSTPDGWESDSTNLYRKIFDWWEINGLKNFFVAYETANRPDDVFLMRTDLKFNNPQQLGGLYRDITITLKGRKE